jgi:hypothetical protein
VKSRVGRFAVRAAIVAALLVSAVAVARAESLPADAAVGVGAPVNADTFVRLVAVQYHVAFRRVVTADIDRDGDLDVLASGDRGLSVWLNDGAGRLRVAAPRAPATLDVGPPRPVWRDSGAGTADPIQNESQPPAGALHNAHAPPAPAVTHSGSAADARRSQPARGSAVPRAPPATSKSS